MGKDSDRAQGSTVDHQGRHQPLLLEKGVEQDMLLEGLNPSL